MPFNKLVRVLLNLFALSMLETFCPRRAEKEPLELGSPAGFRSKS